MNRPEHNNVEFFFGQEVEHTPAFGKKTLFVIGVQPNQSIEKILADPYSNLGGEVEHIYFGANHSFPRLKVNDGGEWAKWETMIYHFLNKKYWCTLDIDISCVEGVVESGLCEHNRFIPMISAKLPYINLLGYNATIKLDDVDFDHSNPGVWCHSVQSLMSRQVFTPWDHYTKDVPV